MERPTPGLCRQLEPGLRAVLAPNPSPMTGWGTDTFVLGTGEVAVIDPGPDLPAHLAAVLAALRPGERISYILVTHPHLDHSALAPALSARTGAPVCGFGPAGAGRSARMQSLAAAGFAGGGEGVDTGFAPDHCLTDGDRVSGPDWHLTALHTPGHFAGHLSFAWHDRLFCGDVAMGWSTSLVSPPDGDMAAYMASLARLMAMDWRIAYPTHGAPIEDVAGRLSDLAAHRRGREAEILATLASGSATLPELTTLIYADTPIALHPAASRNIFAHLVDLHDRSMISAMPTLAPSSQFFCL